MKEWSRKSLPHILLQNIHSKGGFRIQEEFLRDSYRIHNIIPFNDKPILERRLILIVAQIGKGITRII